MHHHTVADCVKLLPDKFYFLIKQLTLDYSLAKPNSYKEFHDALGERRLFDQSQRVENIHL